MNNPEPADICSEPNCGKPATVRDSMDEPWCADHEDGIPEIEDLELA